MVDFQPYKLNATVTESNNEYVLILNGSLVNSCIGVTVGPADDDAASDVSSNDLVGSEDDDAASDVSPNDLGGSEDDETASEADDSAGNWRCPAVTREGRVDAVGFPGVAPIAP